MHINSNINSKILLREMEYLSDNPFTKSHSAPIMLGRLISYRTMSVKYIK